MRKIAIPALAALTALLGIPAAWAAVPAAASPAAVPAPTTASRTAVTAAKPEHPLYGVSCTSAKSCVAVGQDLITGHPLAERWNGTKWTASDLKLPVGATSSALTWVSCAAATTCVAVGQTSVSPTAAPVPLAESWNGTSWSATRPPAPAGSHGAGLGGISCPTVRYCVATGFYVLANGHEAGLAEVLSGGKWTAYKPPGLSNSGQYSLLQDVSCVSAASCVAVGSTGIYGSPGGTPAGTAVAEFWNGRNWSETKLPAPPGTRYAWLDDVSCVPSKACAATGGRYLADNRSTATLAETWTGGTWKTATPSVARGDPTLFAVSCARATNCMAAGGGETTAAHNNAFSDTWNGRSWRHVQMPAPSGGGGNASAVFSVSCLSATYCVAVGPAGPVTRSGVLVYGFSEFWNGGSWRLVATA